MRDLQTSGGKPTPTFAVHHPGAPLASVGGSPGPNARPLPLRLLVLDLPVVLSSILQLKGRHPLPLSCLCSSGVLTSLNHPRVPSRSLFNQTRRLKAKICPGVSSIVNAKRDESISLIPGFISFPAGSSSSAHPNAQLFVAGWGKASTRDQAGASSDAF